MPRTRTGRTSSRSSPAARPTRCSTSAATTARGRGRLADAAGTQLERVSGVEVVPTAADEARARGVEVQVADLNDPLPYDDGSFDLVHANQVIEHVSDLDRFVSEARRVLRPGGRAVVCTENLASWHNVAALVVGYMPFSLANVSSARLRRQPLRARGRVGSGDRAVVDAHTRPHRSRPRSGLRTARAPRRRAVRQWIPPPARHASRDASCASTPGTRRSSASSR